MSLDLDFDPIVQEDGTTVPVGAATGMSTRTGVTSRTVTERVPEVVESAKATPVTGTSYLAKPDGQWGWEDLRNYIFTEIEARHGAQVRDPKKEAGIIKSFMTRWGTEGAVRIARTAFEVHDGMWRGAPISINRFCKNSDTWFSGPIAANF